METQYPPPQTPPSAEAVQPEDGSTVAAPEHPPSVEGPTIDIGESDDAVIELDGELADVVLSGDSSLPPADSSLPPASSIPPAIEDGPAKVPYIPDGMFDAARGRPLTAPPPPREGSASGSMVAIRALIRLEEAFGLRFADPDNMPQATVTTLATLLLDRNWPTGNDLLRDAIVTLLRHLDPNGYPADGPWRDGEITVLKNVLLVELSKREAFADVGKALSAKKFKIAPPRPASKRK